MDSTDEIKKMSFLPIKYQNFKEKLFKTMLFKMELFLFARSVPCTFEIILNR